MANNNEGDHHPAAAAAAALPAASRNKEQAPLSAATRGRGRRSHHDHHDDGSSLWEMLVRLFLGRRDVDHLPPPLLPDDGEGGGGGGEYRLALNASKCQKTCGRGYYFMDAKTPSLPPLMHEHRMLFASLYNKVVTAQRRCLRKSLPTILLLLCPFTILVFTPVTVAIATPTAEDMGDIAIANNPFFLSGVVLSFLLALLLIGPCTKTATREYEAELERLVEESAAEWSATTDYRLSLECDHRCPKLVYLCFRRVETASPPRENLEPNSSSSTVWYSTAEEEAVAASGLEIVYM